MLTEAWRVYKTGVKKTATELVEAFEWVSGIVSVLNEDLVESYYFVECVIQ